MNDLAIKVLLLAIAFGFWGNFMAPLFAASAQPDHGYTLQSTYSRLVAIQSDLAELKREVDEMKNNVVEIQTGTCRNPKIC
jgi:prolipoprotein diacylglyceryltransferase